MTTKRIIVTLTNGRVTAVHSDTHAEVSILDEDHSRDGDAAHAAGLKFEIQHLKTVYLDTSPKKRR